jgi:hypothetical protein
MSEDNDTYFTPKEAAEFLRTTTSTLAKRRLYESNRMPRAGWNDELF